MEEIVLNTIKKYNLINNGDKIVVAVSGGPDSMCLLNVLKNIREKFNLELFVAHINHMIREEADSETEYVKQYCEKNNIKCFVKMANVLEMAKQQKLGTEEMGRIVRYDFFNYVANKVSADKIAIAHTENDNAETVLMNLMRGASLEGLKGIEPIRGKFIRPLIECSRDEIEAYCEENKLDPKFDKTNNDNIYTRNKIRNLLIPYIRQDAKYFSEIVKNEYKNLVIFENVNKERHNIIDKNTNIGTNQEENESQKNGDITELNDINKTNIKKTVEQQIILELKKFNILEYVIKSRILLYTINKLLGTTKGIEKINVEDMIKLCEKNIGNKYIIPNKNLKIFIKKGKVFFIKL